jgi:replicative DNA helicase
MIERKILIGLITQTEYLRQLEGIWNPEYMGSSTAKLISSWCWEFFKKYHRAPMKDIEIIYIKKLKKGGISKDLAEDIEQEILPSLSEEYDNEGINISFLLEETQNYFKERQFIIHNERLSFLLSKNKIDEVEKEISSFKIATEAPKEEIDLSKPEVLSKIESAFDTTYQNLIKFPGALGEFWNEQLVRGSLVGLMAQEKRGKSYWLLEFMMRAYKQKRKVALFQAGDMTENQQIIRICIYLARKSNLEKYCGVKYIPIPDCIKNQADTCQKKIRECNFGVFTSRGEDEIRSDITMSDLKEAYEEFPKYKNCFNCPDWSRNKWGTPWLNKIEIKNPLNSREAKRNVERFFIKAKRSIKISTHVNGTLTLSIMRAALKKWKIEENFVPDVILVDYGDLVEAETKMEERHKQNYIWRGLRALSQEDDSLVIAPTQSDAQSYTKNRLDLINFSEDKRKFGHVTAMYGLNQDTEGREKEIGLMRINKIVIREGDFHSSHEVTVLQRLEIGRPFLGSFY